MTKTIAVSKVREMANEMLLNDHWSDDQRRAICSFVEKVLMDTGNYKGFGYQTWLQGGYAQWLRDGEPNDKAKYLGEEYYRYYFGYPE